jgi:hypothetical protein
VNRTYRSEDLCVRSRVNPKKRTTPDSWRVEIHEETFETLIRLAANQTSEAHRSQKRFVGSVGVDAK